MSLLKKITSAVLSLSIASAAAGVMFSNENISADVIANPVISRNCPAYSNNESSNPSVANDDFYYSFWNSSASTYLAYDLSATPEEQRQQIIAVWYNTTGAYDYTVLPYSSSNSMPTDYTIEVNSADGGTYPEDGWEIAETVENNTYHSRQHVVDMSGYNWIRINITGVDGKADGTASINFDIHNASNGVDDSWIFYGDSITAGGMMNCYGTGFAELVNQIDSNYFPVQENGGIGGIFSTDGANNIDKWLKDFPGKYVSIAYGTNDSWGNQTGAEKYYENTAYMVEKVLESGKTPIVPKIPYSTETGVNTYLADYNAMVDKIYETYPEVIKGPDFETFFKENPELLSGDGVHPATEGYTAMRQIWAETMYSLVYQSAGSDDDTVITGDVNGDGTVDVKDMTELKKYLLKTHEFTYSKANITADMNNNGKINVFDLTLLINKLIKK